MLKKPTIHQAYPEYYLIRTTKFNDVINDTLDEWIYFFKNSEVLDEFRAKGMKAVREKMNVHNLPDEERKKYNKFLENLHTEAGIAETMNIEQEEKMAKKIKEETKKRDITIATNLIRLNLSDEQISTSTGLTIKEVQKLRNNLNINE